MSTESEAPSGPEPSRGQSRGRSAAVWIVLVIAGLLLFLSSFAIWTNRVALNTSGLRGHEQLAPRRPEDPDAPSPTAPSTSSSRTSTSRPRSRPSSRRTTRDCPAQRRPDCGKPRIRSSIERSSSRGSSSSSKTTLEETHRTLVQVLEGGGNRVSTEGGVVTLDLRTIIQEAADRIGIGEQVADKIPADAGRIVILRADELDTAQNAAELLKTLAWVLPILTLAAFALAVWLARDRRRAVRGVGVTLAVVGLVGLVAAKLTGNYVVNSLVARRDDRQAANNAWNILTDLMRGSFRLMIVVGILFLVAAWLAGPGPSGTDHARMDRARAPQSRMGVRRTRDRRAVPAPQRPGDRLHAVARRPDHRRAGGDLDRDHTDADAARVSGHGRSDGRLRCA